MIFGLEGQEDVHLGVSVIVPRDDARHHGAVVPGGTGGDTSEAPVGEDPPCSCRTGPRPAQRLRGVSVVTGFTRFARPIARHVCGPLCPTGEPGRTRRGLERRDQPALCQEKPRPHGRAPAGWSFCQSFRPGTKVFGRRLQRMEAHSELLKQQRVSLSFYQLKDIFKIFNFEFRCRFEI